MERLTKRNKHERAYFPECFKEPCNGLQCAKDDCEFLGKVCEKLAECEDKEEAKKVIKICPVIPEEKYECPECGSPLTDSDVFAGYCKWCGQKITMEGKKMDDKKMDDKTCKTCKDNEDGLCDRKGNLVEDDDSCSKWQPSWKEHYITRFLKVK